jgi:short subunit dehydrogenase-like uncharacterized protein
MSPDAVVTGDPLLVYGATGYSGGLVVRAAIALGLRPVLGGRDKGKLAAIGDSLRLEARTARLGDATALDDALRDVAVVVNAAGPFSQTAGPLLAACLRSGTHYLDITGEVGVIESLARRDVEARRRGIMVMPAVGFDVVPSDCLALHVVRRLPGARRLALGLRGLSSVTRASAKTLFEAVDMGLVRRNGELVRLALGSRERLFDFGDGPATGLNVSWGDLATAYYTTGIPDIETYVEATPFFRGVLAGCRLFGSALRTAPWQAAMRAWADLLPDHPAGTPAREMVVVADAEDQAGRRVRARVRTPEAYQFTGISAAGIAQRVLRGDHETGFQTPARVYGPDLVLTFPGVSREDLA